jgi:hypothetical protein
MSQLAAEIKTTAEGHLLLLWERRVRYLFATPGSDAAQFVEAYARMKEVGGDGPIPVSAPHEMCTVSMAHGYAMVRGELRQFLFTLRWDGQRRRPANMTMGILMREAFMLPAGLGLESFGTQVSGRASPQISPSFN